MRVVHFRRRFSALSETFIYDFVCELRNQGCTSSVVTNVRENEQSRPFAPVQVIPDLGRWHPTRLLAKCLTRATASASLGLVWRANRKHLRRTLRELSPDVIQAHFGKEGVIIAPVSHELRIPLVVSFHGYDVSRLPELPEWQQYYQQLWPRVAAVTVVSNEMRAAVARLGCPPSKINVIRVGKDLRDYPFLSRRRAIRTLVSVGRLEPKKGHLDAIRGLQYARARGAQLELSIVGSGTLARELEEYVAHEGLGQSVRLLGEMPHGVTKQYMAAADAFVLCSKTAPNGNREGAPTVLMEAQAMGLPCVSTRHAGIPETIARQNSWLMADEGDIVGIGERLLALAAAPTDQLDQIAHAGRAHVEVQHDLHANVGQLRALLEKVSGSRPRGFEARVMRADGAA